MYSSIHFPDPQPQLSDVEAHLQDFQEELSICRRKGNLQDTAAKNGISSGPDISRM